MKTGIISYITSDNLGDYIQTIAVEQLLREKATHFDREMLHLNPEKEYKLLINGWFMEQPTHWPPHPRFTPLFFSFHLNPTAEDHLLTPEGVAYFQKHQPIGCRDHYTRKKLQKHGIEAYFSACVTLGLSQSQLKTESNKIPSILVMSAFERLESMGKALDRKSGGGWQRLKAAYNRFRFSKAHKRLNAFLNQVDAPVLYRSQILPPSSLTPGERFEKAQEQLAVIAQARLVITSRIHTALPAVAMGTPVLFLTDGLEHPNQSSRLEGLSQFFTCINSNQLKTIDWETLENPQNPEPYVAKMKEKVNQFLETDKK